MTRTLLLALAALATAAPAGAATGAKPPGVRLPPQTEQQKLDAYLHTARSYWPASPCAGREQITLNADAEIAARAPVGRHNASGWGDPAGCLVYMRGGLDLGAFCLTLAHELGHLAGQPHADHGIMNGARMERVGPCEDRHPADVFSGAWYRAVAALPDRGRGWHITRTGTANRWISFTARKRGFLDRRLHARPPGLGATGYVEWPEIRTRRRP